MWEIAVLGGARPPFTVWAGGHKPDGTKGGALKELDAYDLGAVALRGALARFELRRRRARYGVASVCIGGGQGIAALVEA